MPKWLQELDAVNPHRDNGVWTVGVAKSKVALLLDRGHQVKAFRLRLVEEVLAEPICILRGWGRPGTDGYYVYVGQPKSDFRSGSIEVPAPPNKLFVVFVLDDGTIDDWNWRDKSPEDPSLPEGLNREEVVWQ